MTAADGTGVQAYNRGVVLYSKARYSEAAEAFDECFHAGEYRMQAAYARGLCQHALGEPVDIPAEFASDPEGVGAVYVASNLAWHLVAKGHRAEVKEPGDATNVEAEIMGSRYILEVSAVMGSFSNWAWRIEPSGEVSIPDPDENPNPTRVDRYVISLMERASDLPPQPIPGAVPAVSAPRDRSVGRDDPQERCRICEESKRRWDGLLYTPRQVASFRPAEWGLTQDDPAAITVSALIGVCVSVVQFNNPPGAAGEASVWICDDCRERFGLPEGKRPQGGRFFAPQKFQREEAPEDILFVDEEEPEPSGGAAKEEADMDFKHFRTVFLIIMAVIVAGGAFLIPHILKEDRERSKILEHVHELEGKTGILLEAAQNDLNSAQNRMKAHVVPEPEIKELLAGAREALAEAEEHVAGVERKYEELKIEDLPGSFQTHRTALPILKEYYDKTERRYEELLKEAARGGDTPTGNGR
ncbi:MAG: hypothetical protein JW909_02145 [Planctomycetes bacterium]|nr:hypothetical protein [Planctomycetota bacterium]